jgi:hypothetical protein
MECVLKILCDTKRSDSVRRTAAFLTYSLIGYGSHSIIRSSLLINIKNEMNTLQFQHKILTLCFFFILYSRKKRNLASVSGE